MSSRHLLDPQLAAGLAKLPPFSDLSERTLAELRDMMRTTSRSLIETTPTGDVDVTTRSAPGFRGAPAVRMLVYEPKARTDRAPALLHIHGGGFVSGMPEMRHLNSIHFARSLGCIVVSVDYRLAPEHPYPDGIDDCYAALHWLHAVAAELGIDPARIAIAGESAGGGLAAALALLARDRGELAVCFQLLAYPMINDRNIENDNPHIGEFVWTNENNKFGWASLLRGMKGSVPQYAAASRATDLAGLPPAFIAVGALDLFVEDNIDYARRLVRAGVPTEFHMYPGAFHAFDLVADAGITQCYRADRDDALRRAFNIEKISGGLKDRQS